MDYHIFDKIAERVNARVVVVEVNGEHITNPNFNFLDPPDHFPEYAGRYKWDGMEKQKSSSPLAMTKLAHSKGYEAVSILTGDMIFVRRDELETLKLRTGISFVTDIRGLMYTDKKVVEKTNALIEAGNMTSLLENNPAFIVAEVFEDMRREGAVPHFQSASTGLPLR